MYVRARYYDPVNGTWISRDPIGFDGQNWNTNDYVNNNPVTQADPSGLQVGQPGPIDLLVPRGYASGVCR